MRKCGELLKMFDARGDNAKKQMVPDRHLISKEDAGKQAGLSGHQIKTSNRLANIPENEFERAIESDTPPTLTELLKNE